MNGLGGCWGSNPEWNRMHCIHVLSHNLPLQIINFCLIGGGPPRHMLHKQMPWESTWFIFSCNPIVHSSLSNRNTFCRNDKSLTNEFRRVSHTSSDWKIHKSPQKKHLLPGSTNVINCNVIWLLQFKCDDCMTKNPLTLEPWWVDPLTKHLSSFSSSFTSGPLSLSLSCDVDFRTRHVGIFKVAIPTEACRINQEAVVFSGEGDDCFLLFRDPLIWPNQFYCEWSKKYLPWRKYQKATWHSLPMGDGGLQVSPKTTNAQLFVLRAPAFFPFNSISCLVMSTPQRFCSKSPLGWGQNGSNRGGTT